MRAILILLCLAPTVRADTFTLRVGSYQKGPGPRYCHTFAVAERFSPDGQREQLCISWQPRAVWRVGDGPVPGCNWSLEATLAHAARLGVSVVYQPVIEIDVTGWERFRAQVLLLESGRIAYIGIEEGRRPGCCNCIGAVGVAVLGYRPPTGFRYGYRAGPAIHHEYMRRHR